MEEVRSGLGIWWSVSYSLGGGGWRWRRIENTGGWDVQICGVQEGDVAFVNLELFVFLVRWRGVGEVLKYGMEGER